MKRTSIALGAMLLLTGCGASPGTMQNLANAQGECSQGNLQACNDIPYVQQAAAQEAKANTALLLLPLAILLVLAGGGHGR